MNAGHTSSIAHFRARQQEAWRSGRRVTVEELVGDAPDVSLSDDELLELVYAEICLREEHGEPAAVEEYVARFGRFQERLERLFEMHREFGKDSWERFQGSQVSLASTRDRFGEVDTSLEPSTDHDRPLQQIGRFVVERRLGEGSFGVVYLAHDQDLDRRVAVKVPRQDRFGGEEEIERFLREARLAASLDHPGIVPVYEVQRDEDLVYIVQKYIDGQDLTAYAATHDPTQHRITELMIQVAEAVGAAHDARLFHRDLKGANILVDASGRPYVADFGLALQAEQQHLHRGETAGSIPYMAPEQVRGEAHLLDGRADIWALGVILYELLTGTQPFQGPSALQVFAEIEGTAPPAPHQVNAHVPRELSRICLACLAKRAADRYQSTKELAEDLQHWLRETAAKEEVEAGAEASPRIVPKGLRSFDAEDADFFLELLPGPRDREGLPATLRFWKQRIESTSDDTCRVGLLYGPSGCGKSSLVKAGLLPRLAGHVIPVYVEATAGDTEARLLTALRAVLPDRSADASLADLIASLRQRGAPGGRKVLLVVDQFEQWLHAHDPDSGQELVRALRQCDGKHVQCLLLVRDDFWMSITRFMKALDVQLIEDQNSVAVDLFDVDHAQKVLAAFGRAYGKLADETLSAEQAQFLEEAVAGLADEGQIVCVHLALFAQMMQGRSWTPASLHEVGGTEGVGVTFLEETFSSPAAPPQYRLHEEGVRSVLRALLPDSGTAIKGRMRSREELMRVADYGGRPSEFDTLLGILDREVRLITPTEPEQNGRAAHGTSRQGGEEGTTTEDTEHDTEHTEKKGGAVDREASDDSPDPSAASAPPLINDRQALAEPAAVFYQLTHDYLVPALGEWLTRKQKENRRGRAEVRLADLAAAWNRHPENRHLPSLLEYASIRRLTRKDRWSESEQRLMRRAGTVWGARLTVALVILAVLIAGGLIIRGRVLAHQARVAEQEEERRSATRAAGLVEALLVADVQEVPELIEELEPLRQWADTLLREENAAAAMLTRAKLHTSLALLPINDEQVDYLVAHLLTTNNPPEVLVIADQLKSCPESLEQRLWDVMDETGDSAGPRKLRAACALAAFDQDDSRWTEIRDDVADELVGVSTVYLQTWMEALRPARHQIVPAIVHVFADDERPPLEHSVAKDVLVDFGRDLPWVLANAIQTADQAEFAELFPILAGHADEAIPLLAAFLQERAQPDWQDARIDPRWPDANDEMKATFERAGGMLADRFAYCPSLLLDEFPTIAEELAASGYRPHRVRPYEVSDTLRVAATWRRDGRPWKWLMGTAEEIRNRDRELRAQGFLPCDVTAIHQQSTPLENGSRLAAVWIAGRVGEPERRLLLGLPLGEADSAAEDLYAAGFPQRVGLCVQPLAGDALQVSMILAEGESVESQSHADSGSFRFNDVHLQLLLVDLQVAAQHPWRWLFVTGQSPAYQSAAWMENLAYESRVLSGLRPSEHPSRAQAQVAEDYRPVVVDVMELADGELLVSSLWHRPIIPEAVKENLVRRQANAAAALLRMGHAQAVWPQLKHREYADDCRRPDDPRLRTYLIHGLSSRGVDPQAIIAQFRAEDDVSIRRALLLTLGEFTRVPMDERARQDFVAELADVYRRHPDAGLHAAVEWLLRTWGEGDRIREIQEGLKEDEEARVTRQRREPRDWYMTSEGHTMVAVEPGQVLVGSHRMTDPDRITDEPRHRKRIARRFALAATEVTREQYRRFQDASIHAKMPLADNPELSRYVRTDDSPMVAMEWYEAAAYCNWLSGQEGIPEDQWVYESNDRNRYGPGMRARPGYQDLVGYRLPSEAEWEYACRAGALTPRYYGSSDEFLDRYAWYDGNSAGHTWPVGLLMPNDLGLFDMHGNVWNWCHNRGGTWWSASVLEDAEDSSEVEDRDLRVLRGGSWQSPSRLVRSAHRSILQPDARFTYTAFRPARTLPESPIAESDTREADCR